MDKKKSLLDLVDTQSAPVTARAIVVKHADEIRELQAKGIFLKKIYTHLTTLYAEEMKLKSFNFSEAHFYKLWKSINSPNKKKQVPQDSLKDASSKTTGKSFEWNAESGTKHPFLDEDN